MNTNSIKEYLEEEIGEPLYFFEYREALVKTDMTGVNYQTCSDEDFYKEAAEQGTIFSLKGFELFIYSGALTEMMNSVQHPYYLLPRFIPVFQDDYFRTYIDTRENRRNRYEL